MHLNVCIMHMCISIYLTVCYIICTGSCTGTVNLQEGVYSLQEGIIRIKYGVTFNNTGDLNTIHGLTANDCSDECSSRPGCNAATYQTKVHLCRLSSTIVQDNDLNTDGGSVTFLGFTTFKDRASCGQNTCSKKESCRNISGNLVCQTLECGIPSFIPTSVQTAGNMYRVGARLLLSNTYYASYIECTAKGIWCVTDTTWHACHNSTCFMGTNYVYRSVSIQSTMQDAKKFCNLANSQLIEVKSEKIMVVLQHLLRGIHHRASWIGLVYKPNLESWRWGSGEALEFIHWKPGEPTNQFNSENCVVSSDAYGTWNDISCYKYYPFTCQTQNWGSNDKDEIRQCM